MLPHFSARLKKCSFAAAKSRSAAVKERNASVRNYRNSGTVGIGMSSWLHICQVYNSDFECMKGIIDGKSHHLELILYGFSMFLVDKFVLEGFHV